MTEAADGSVFLVSVVSICLVAVAENCAGRIFVRQNGYNCPEEWFIPEDLSNEVSFSVTNRAEVSCPKQSPH